MIFRPIFLIFIFISPLLSDSAVVFMYHRFGESKYPATNITIKQFQSHLDYLEKNNYNIWPLSKIVKSVVDKKSLPPKTVAITIDDAYLSIYTDAFPMLKKKKFPYTVFVNTNVVDKKYKDFMTWDQMREMQKFGAEFANHSANHDVLIPKKTEDEFMWKNRIKKEVVDAQKRLDEEIGYKRDSLRLLSYPYGEYSMESASFIRELGYIGVAQTSGPIGMDSDLRELPRFAMNEAYGDLKSFITKLRTLPMPIHSASPKDHIINIQNPPMLKIKLKEALNDLRCYLSNGEPLPLNWVTQTEVKVFSKTVLTPPRDRYNCTARAGDGRYYWYSHLWIVKD